MLWSVVFCSSISCVDEESVILVMVWCGSMFSSSTQQQCQTLTTGYTDKTQTSSGISNPFHSIIHPSLPCHPLLLCCWTYITLSIARFLPAILVIAFLFWLAVADQQKQSFDTTSHSHSVGMSLLASMICFINSTAPSPNPAVDSITKWMNLASCWEEYPYTG